MIGVFTYDVRPGEISVEQIGVTADRSDDLSRCEVIRR